MSAQKGSLVLLKILQENGQYQTIGGLRTTKFSLNNQLIDASNKSSGCWRLLLENAGISSVSIAGNGVFTDSSAEDKVRQYAFSGAIKNYQLTFGNGDRLEGCFFIANYERVGNYAEEETYALTLESSGIINYFSVKVLD